MSLALALALIMAPEPVKAPDPALMGPVKHLALSLELLDPQEGKWVFINPEQFGEDLLLIRQRYKELWDAPPACDAVRFPSSEMCQTLMSQNRQYKLFLEDRLNLGESLAGNWLEEALQETEYLFRVWAEARDAQVDYFYLTVRRKALKKLRDELIGPAAYYGGFLPPHVPIWRFRRVD